MEIEIQETANAKKIETKTKTIILIAVAAFTILMLLAASVFSFMVLKRDTIYKGVHVGSQNASGLGENELQQLLYSKYQSPIKNLEITLKVGESELTADYKALNVSYDTVAAASNAYAIGRHGNIFNRLNEIFRAAIAEYHIGIPLVYDDEKLDSFIDNFYNMTLINVKEGSLLISNSGVTMVSGSHGENIDKIKTKEDLVKLIEANRSGTIEPEVIITPPSKFNVDDLYNQILTEPTDASYIVENSALKLIPHTNGHNIDKSALERIAADLADTENVTRELPVSIVTPNITSDNAKTSLFRDVLASYSTSFGTGTQNGKNRAHNMGLTAAKINNYILAPGDEFSFNKVVGRRNAENGYKMAHVYSAGQIVDGIGGGICQVSSTMYNAILNADLLVTERRNHSFTVGYVPLGQDATAFYGAVDLRFVNSTKWPIKLQASIKNNKVHFSIKGTNENPNKQVVISNKILKKTDFVEVFTDDPTKPEGYVDITVPGMAGYVVETYKTIKIDGKVVSQNKLHTSSYKAYAQQVTRGTKPVESTSPPSPPETTEPVEVPVDEAPPVIPPEVDPFPEEELSPDEATPEELPQNVVTQAL